MTTALIRDALTEELRDALLWLQAAPAVEPWSSASEAHILATLLVLMGRDNDIDRHLLIGCALAAERAHRRGDLTSKQAAAHLRRIHCHIEGNYRDDYDVDVKRWLEARMAALESGDAP